MQIPKEFYPTPIPFVHQMLEDLDFSYIRTVLEPSAGDGIMVPIVQQRIRSKTSYWRDDMTYDIDVIELDENLRHILKGKGYRVVHDDFLTYRTSKQYDLIVMNPPFSEGDKHLSKALDMQKRGGHIRCLLNAQTLKNPCTNLRKQLVRRLEEYNAEVEYIPHVFDFADRATSVEIAFVKIAIPENKEESIILDDVERAKSIEDDQREVHDLVSTDFIKAILDRYELEARAGITLIQEYKALQPYLIDSLKSKYTNPILELKLHRSDESSGGTLTNDYVRAVRKKYWEALFTSPEFMGTLTSNLQQELMNKVRELADYEFSYRNVLAIQIEVNRSLNSSIESTILDLFDELSHQYSYIGETSKNIHYYDGWRTNKAHKINKKVIIPLNAYDTYDGRFSPEWRVRERLTDIERCLDFLDAGRTSPFDLQNRLDEAKEGNQTKNIGLKYFYVTFYKKGTCHIVFNNIELLDKFNLFGSQRKGWLPPSYGKKAYRDMDDEEKSVVDSYEGENSYNNTMDNKDYYLVDTGALLKLEGI